MYLSFVYIMIVSFNSFVILSQALGPWPEVPLPLYSDVTLSPENNRVKTALGTRSPSKNRNETFRIVIRKKCCTKYTKLTAYCARSCKQEQSNCKQL